MRTYYFGFILVALSLSGCSKADDNPELQQEYLYSEIDGEEFEVNHLNGMVQCRKLITAFGTVNLSLKVEKSDGKIMEFLILNYSGDKNIL